MRSSLLNYGFFETSSSLMNDLHAWLRYINPSVNNKLSLRSASVFFLQSLFGDSLRPPARCYSNSLRQLQTYSDRITIRMGGRGTLNGAYYADSSGTPLPAPAVHKIPRTRGGCCCLFCHFLRIVMAVGVAVGVAALVIWLVVRPTKPRFHVESASVSNFNLTGGTLDAIHMRLNIACRNPSKRMGIYYHSLYASAYYRDHMIAWSSAFPTFYQPHKNTIVLQPILIGESIHLPTDVSEELSSTYKSQGGIQMNVSIHSRIRLKVGPFKSKRYTIKVKCNLLLDGLNRTTTFGEHKCKVDF